MKQANHIISRCPALDTEGLYDFATKLRGNFTAHPKVDPITGEMLAFCYFPQATALFYQIDKAGVLTSTTAIKLQKSSMMHDFAVTPNYAIFFELPQTFTMTRAMSGKPPWYFDAKAPSRFGIISRKKGADGKNAIKWFEAKTCYIFHTLNSFEQGDEVIVQGLSAILPSPVPLMVVMAQWTTMLCSISTALT